jgi:hypothetical protein
MKNRRLDRAPAACARARKAAWPEGATAGLLLVATACLAATAMLYHVAGPSDAFAQE